MTDPDGLRAVSIRRSDPFWTEDAVHSLIRDLEKRARSPRTIAFYLGATAYLPARWPLTAMDVVPSLQAIAHLSAIKRHHYIRTWRTLARFVESTGGAAGALAEVRIPLKPKPLPRVAVESDVQSLFDACTSPREVAFVATIVGTGIRFGELPQRRAQIHDGAIETHDGKGGTRLVPITGELQQLLTGFGDSEWLWLGHRKTGRPRRYRPLKASGLRSLWRRIEDRAGVSVNPHSCRHKFGTDLANDGVDILPIKDLMGHKSIVSTQIYIHLAVKRLAGVMNAHSPLHRYRLPNQGDDGFLTEEAA